MLSREALIHYKLEISELPLEFQFTGYFDRSNCGVNALISSLSKRLICLLREVKKLPGKDSGTSLLSFLISVHSNYKSFIEVQRRGKALRNEC